MKKIFVLLVVISFLLLSPPILAMNLFRNFGPPLEQQSQIAKDTAKNNDTSEDLSEDEIVGLLKNPPKSAHSDCGGGRDFEFGNCTSNESDFGQQEQGKGSGSFLKNIFNLPGIAVGAQVDEAMKPLRDPTIGQRLDQVRGITGDAKAIAKTVNQITLNAQPFLALADNKGKEQEVTTDGPDKLEQVQSILGLTTELVQGMGPIIQDVNQLANTVMPLLNRTASSNEYKREDSNRPSDLAQATELINTAVPALKETNNIVQSVRDLVQEINPLLNTEGSSKKDSDRPSDLAQATALAQEVRPTISEASNLLQHTQALIREVKPLLMHDKSVDRSTEKEADGRPSDIAQAIQLAQATTEALQAADRTLRTAQGFMKDIAKKPQEGARHDDLRNDPKPNDLTVIRDITGNINQGIENAGKLLETAKAFIPQPNNHNHIVGAGIEEAPDRPNDLDKIKNITDNINNTMNNLHQTVNSVNKTIDRSVIVTESIRRLLRDGVLLAIGLGIGTAGTLIVYKNVQKIEKLKSKETAYTVFGCSMIIAALAIIYNLSEAPASS